MPFTYCITAEAMATPARPVATPSTENFFGSGELSSKAHAKQALFSRQNHKDLAAEALGKAMASWKVHIEAHLVYRTP